MQDNKQTAKQLFFGTNKTKKDIAQTAGVDERTLYRWIKQESWDILKKAAQSAPAIVIDNLYSQLAELQTNIANREEGNRIPTMPEMEITRKLINCIHRMDTKASLGEHVQMMTGFVNYMRPVDLDFTKKLAEYANTYMIKSSHRNGYMPYEFHYDTPDVVADKEEIEAIKKQMADEDMPVPVSLIERQDPLKNEIEKPDITEDSTIKDIENEYVTTKNVGNTPCQDTDKVGHTEPQKPVDKGELYRQRYPHIPLLTGGIIWIGNSKVYDPLCGERTIKIGEADQYTQLGFTRRDLAREIR